MKCCICNVYKLEKTHWHMIKNAHCSLFFLFVDTKSVTEIKLENNRKMVTHISTRSVQFSNPKKHWKKNPQKAHTSNHVCRWLQVAIPKTPLLPRKPHSSEIYISLTYTSDKEAKEFFLSRDSIPDKHWRMAWRKCYSSVMSS